MMTQSIITAGDASSGLQILSGDDGTLVLQSGPAGAKLNALSIDAAGVPTLLKPPKLAAGAVVSMVRLNTANGYGSTNTKIRRFTNIVTNTGSDITYADSATLGASFTINTSGVYAISYTDQFSAAANNWVTLNDTAPTAATPVTAEVLAGSTTPTSAAGGCASWSGYLASGSVIRAHTTGTASGASTGIFEQFTITKVA